jgi:pyruvate dehydrogenase E2 component (dihydrolipoamide acetyltransferase)
MTDIVMPRLSDTMEEGTILRWLVADGEHVRRGQELVEIETDKATMVYESDAEGTLATLAQEGQTLAVGEPIARVGDQPGDGAGATPAAVAAAAVDQDGPALGGPAGMAAPSAAAPPGTTPAPEVPARVRASPLARRIARERGVDIGALRGSGPAGRIVKADVQAWLGEAPGGAPAARPQADAGAASALTAPTRPTPAPSVSATTPPSAHAPTSTPAPASAPPPGSAPAPAPGGIEREIASAKGQATEVELSRTQQAVARRMAESKATIPHFALEADVDMEECVSLRSELKRVAPAGEGAPTYNDMVVKACALALRAHPRANSSYRDARLTLYSRVNVGVAVATESDELHGGALVVPTVFDADRKALGEIARESRALAARVRDGSITPPELSGATFTVSNLGMFGIDRFNAIINPPQAAILAVGAVTPRAVVRDGGISVRHTMSLTLACDHRVLYGADAARFLANVRDLLQRPAALSL